MQQAAPPPSSGNILQSASHVAITGGSFVAGSQYNVTTTANEPNKLLYKQVAPNAILNAGGRADEVKCLPGTREEVLAKTEAWIDAKESERERKIFWLSGPAGAGKSAIIQTLAERCMARSVSVTNFFFFRGDNTRNDARPVVATLLYQLIASYPKLKDLIRAVLVEKPLIFNQALHDQFEHLINTPIRSIIDPSLDRWSIVILIDGLDECGHGSDGRREQDILLRVLHRLVSSENSPFIVLVASRPEPHLTMTFNEVGSFAASIFLNEDHRPSDDIRLFVIAESARIKNTHHLGHTLDRHWPSQSSIDAVVMKSSGQFIYAATVLRFIAHSPVNPAHSLDKVQGLRPVAKSSPFSQIDAIYSHILSSLEDLEAAKDVLAGGIFRTNYFPADMRDIKPILAPLWHQEDELASYISDLMAIVRFDDKNGAVLFYHASLRDFLRDSTRSGKYHIDLDAFTERLAIAHIKGIRDIDSLEICFLVVCCVRQSTLSIEEALTSYPSEFIPRSMLSGYTLNRTIRAFFNKFESLYFQENRKRYKQALRNWLIWFRNMNIGLHPETDLKGVKHVYAIWKEIIDSETPFWKRYFT